jgi:hypothetical protein
MVFVLRGVTYEACLVCLNDVIVVGWTFYGRLDNVRKVFQRLRGARLKLNPEKCQLFQKEVRYLRHRLIRKGWQHTEKLDAAQRWPPARDKYEFRSFLWLCTCYERFIAGFSEIPALRPNSVNRSGLTSCPRRQTLLSDL